MTTETTIAPLAPLDAAAQGGRRLRGVALFSVLAALMLTLLLEALDQTIVGTAMPRIIAQLHGFDRYTWVVTGYTLASIIMVPLIGALSDQFGRKGFLVAGVALFLLGSALSGTVQTMDQLIIFRAVQGLGAGMGIALSFTVVADIFPPAERAKWGALFGSVYGVSNAIGPTIGGWLTDHGPLLGTLVTATTRWRWVFYINLPVGLIALALLLIYVPANISVRGSHHTGWAAVRRIDFLGAALMTAATVCLLLGLTWGGNGTYAWGAPQVAGLLAGAGVLYALFLLVERGAVAPILPLDLFRNGVFATASLLSMLQMMALLGMFIYLPLFLQGVLGESATVSGALITPLSFSAVVGAMIGGMLIARRKRYRNMVIVSGVVMTIGAFLLTRMTPSTSALEAAIFMVIAGLGMGPFFSVLTLVAQNALPVTRLGAGTGAVRFLGQLGAVLGTAIVGTVVTQTLTHDMATRLPAAALRQLTPAGVKAVTNPQALVNPSYRQGLLHTAERLAARAAAAHAPAEPGRTALVQQAIAQAHHLLDQVFAALKLSLAVAIQHGFVAVVIFCLALTLAAFFLKDIPLSEQFVEEPAATPQPEPEAIRGIA